MAKRLVRLTWLDDTGEAYHTADLSPSIAREMLKRDGVFFVRFPGQNFEGALHHLTRAAIERSSRGAIGKKNGATRVLITLPEDNP